MGFTVCKCGGKVMKKFQSFDFRIYNKNKDNVHFLDAFTNVQMVNTVIFCTNSTRSKSIFSSRICTNSTRSNSTFSCRICTKSGHLQVGTFNVMRLAVQRMAENPLDADHQRGVTRHFYFVTRSGRILTKDKID